MDAYLSSFIWIMLLVMSADKAFAIIVLNIVYITNERAKDSPRHFTWYTRLSAVQLMRDAKKCMLGEGCCR